MSKSKVFIGSSVEGISVAYSIQENLKHAAEATVWDQGVFQLSQTAIESLITVLDNSDFGVFVFTPDDILNIRGKKNLAVRDNVLFELGLFIGKLGRNKCFIVTPDKPDIHLPTDLLGVNIAKYESNRSDKNLQAATGGLCHKIKEAIGKTPSRVTVVQNEPETEFKNDSKTVERETSWFGLADEKKYDEAISVLKNKINKEKDALEKINLKSWLCYVEFCKEPVNGRKQFEKLIASTPGSNIPYLRLSQTFSWQKNYYDAVKIADEGLRNSEKKISLTVQKAKCLSAINKKEEAMKLLEEYFAISNEPLIALELSKVYIKLDKKEEAINLLNSSMRAFPGDEEVISEFAALAQDLGLTKLRLVLYSKLVSLDESNATYSCHLGNCYYDLDLFDLAFVAYDKGLSLSKHDKQGWILANMGNLYSSKQLYHQADVFLKESQGIEPDSEYTLKRRSEVQKAIEEEDKILQGFLTEGLEILNRERITIDKP
ncbi:TIR domain-containing protein [Chryseolinea soli]|uniref:CD-NTase-associated protein 12/Pycsar effector protein TIR domain-containing protein n=1 Tax=Chryseolinea soli TaxID=2321403 RepID=A0A385SW24_9BACT|nr:TIR domain-containing protein [Chryseolinea soli]AYB32998.1 hypothetical protein D4L85_21535 [Chryseolinea soli]